MRSVISRGVFVVLLSAGVAAGALAAPRTEGAQNGVVRTVKRIIRSLGDFITIPIGAPTPAPKQP